MGGGDIKILTIGFIWMGLSLCAPLRGAARGLRGDTRRSGEVRLGQGPIVRRQEARPVGTVGHGGTDPTLHFGLPAADVNPARHRFPIHAMAR